MESGDLEEGSRSFPQQDQKLSVVDLAIAVEVGLVDHLLDVDLRKRNGVGVHEVFDVVFVQFAIAVHIEFLELFSQEFLVLNDVRIEETRNELSVVHLATVVEVHCVEDLLEVAGVQIGIDLLAQVLKADHHFLLGDHAVAVDVELHEDFAEVFDLLFGDLDSQVHENGLFQTKLKGFYSFIVTSFLRPLKTS